MHSHAQAPASMKGKTAKEVAREIENADPLKVGEPGPSHPSLHSRTKRTTDCISNSHMIALALNLGCAQTELAPNQSIAHPPLTRLETTLFLPPWQDADKQAESIRFQTAVVACVIARLLTGRQCVAPGREALINSCCVGREGLGGHKESVA